MINHEKIVKTIETTTLEKIKEDLFLYDEEQLIGISYLIFQFYDILKYFNWTKRIALTFIIDIANQYQEIPYHSFYHAVHVSIKTHKFLTIVKEQKTVSKERQILLIISAFVHDIGHDGCNNAFHVKKQSSIAIKYKNLSVLENNSYDITLKLLTKYKIKKLNLKELKENLIATDLEHHKDFIVKLDSMLKVEDEPFCCSLILHAADISNPVNPWLINKKWNSKLTEEFYNQGDLERTKKLEISAMMDRNKDNPIENEIKFNDSFVLPLFRHLNRLFNGFHDWLHLIIQNQTKWKAL